MERRLTVKVLTMATGTTASTADDLWSAVVLGGMFDLQRSLSLVASRSPQSRNTSARLPFGANEA
ncbi:MAG: hypothetical protein ACYDBU_03540 [Vulcanimicrobiaceae bacterium]